MPDMHQPTSPSDDGVEDADPDETSPADATQRTGEEQAAENREADPPA